MSKPYTYLEVEAIENDYDQQVPIKVIAEHVNADFHSGEAVRTPKAISYVIGRLNADDGWKERLEEVWEGEGA